MKNYIVELSVNERLSAYDEIEPERTAKIVTELLEMAKLGQVYYDGWQYDHGEETDNQDDSDAAIGITATHFEIRLAVDESVIDYTDDGSSFYNYVIDALSFRPSQIVNDYVREQGALSNTIIEIRVGEINTDAA